MTTYSRSEISVGVFVIIGVLALGYLSISIGGLRLGGRDVYTVSARFASVGSLKSGDPVKIAGVAVGEVGEIRLVDFAAKAELVLQKEVTVPSDTFASVQSAGLLGDSYVSLSPGAADDDLKPGGEITRTESAISLTELVSKYAFGSRGEEAPRNESDEENKSEKKNVFEELLE